MNAPVFLSAEWRQLVMLNYRIAPEVLGPFLPRGVELDAWEGNCFVSVVGFLFLNTRVRGLPVPFHRHFEEVNLRFYVRGRGPEGWRRGVVFIKEIVPRRLIAAVARLAYNEKYIALPMRHALTESGPANARRIEFAWRAGGRWNRLAASVAGEPSLPVRGSQEAFITEHYWGYSAQRDGGTKEYRVEHPPWRVWPAQAVQFDCEVAALYGQPFEQWLGAPPASAFVAEGSAVKVRAGVRLAP
jgi:uncharacterized protein YqjF (DUF2071 family)